MSLHSVARENEIAFKKKTKEYYDKGVVARSYQLGEMVLLHTPNLTGSLCSVWEGPYAVVDVLSLTSYRLSIPGKTSLTLVTHINRLKTWVTPTANVFRVVVGKDSEGSDSPVGSPELGAPDLDSDQLLAVNNVLGKFSDVLKAGKLGCVEGGSMVIDTGDSRPVQIHPYRVAPAWRDELQREVFKLLHEGVIEVSKSPWSAPMVPVRKPDGSVRLCIDFRGLNSVMLGDPYPMPNIEELLGKVAEAQRISKLDMSRVFLSSPLSP